MTAYPNAKIMLNTRNEDDWYKSVCKTFFDPVIEERWTIIRWHFANALWQAGTCTFVAPLLLLLD